MNPANDPLIPAGAHDFARLAALEHMVAILWVGFAQQQAGLLGLTSAEVARNFREAVTGSLVEGRWPADILALIRGHARMVMDKAVLDAETSDRLAAATRRE